MKKIFLYGAPASGKTTLGALLAGALGARHVDLDAEIAASAGRSIPDIFAAEGEAGFRDREAAALAAVCAADGAAVVSLGGGSLLRDANRGLCERAGEVFCLRTPSDEELQRRLGAAPGSRPLGDRARERAAHYASFPLRIEGWFDLGNSLVVVGRGIAGAVLAGERAAADETVARLYPGLFGDGAARLVASIPSGERHKNVGTVSSLWSAFAAAGLGRRDRVAAVGGGVTGDLVGFASATWMRGMDWINVPTTLLSMVDASTGGKTGFDLPEGKNLVGAFHSPRLVVVDADFLATLPPETLRQGRAEMVKHELVGGRLPGAAGGMPSAEEIAANLAVKVGVVKEDPFERTGRRMVLNCGHTVGHAVEALSGYRISHGEAVAIGCCEEARIAAARSLAPADWPAELAARFAAEGLPTEIPPEIDRNRIDETMKGDKKRAGDVVAFALPCGWGDVRIENIDLGAETLFHTPALAPPNRVWRRGRRGG